MIGEIRKAVTPFYNQLSGKMSFKKRPVLILAKADQGDYVVLPISSVSKKQNIHPIYDIQIDPALYPKLNLTKVSYVRTHKQTIINASEIHGLYGDLKHEYTDLYLVILEKRDAFNQSVTSQAL